MRHAEKIPCTAGPTTATRLVPLSAGAQQDDSVETMTVREGSIHMLAGRGGDVDLSVGSDGAFPIDDTFAPSGSDFMPPDRFVGLVYRGMVEDR